MIKSFSSSFLKTACLKTERLLPCILMLLLLASTLISPITNASPTDKYPPLDDQHIQEFCTEKPIWAAFDIQHSTCIDATQHCVQKVEFAGINPDTLSEPFYRCVFQQLDIDF